MKKYFLLVLLSCLSFTTNALAYPQPTPKKKKEQKKEAQVYVCDSKSAYAYHVSGSCRGLNRCSHGVIKMGLSEAKNSYGRKLCRICG